MAFNTSLAREETSMKIRSQNIKQARDMTKQLESENQRMELRLNELKMAIRRDREDRGNTGFWGKGQQGSLGNYANEVLSQPSSAKSGHSSGKKKKVKVLKDEPIAKTERKVQPGSYGNIAMRDTTPRQKVKGLKCGQCEMKAAHVSCHECGEDYCAACFAAFHLKGALRRHRSLPVGSNGGITVRSSSRSSYYDASGASGDVPPRSQRSLNSEADVSVLPASARTPSPTTYGFSGPSLLKGTYNENEAQASFQQALSEWRQGKTTSGGQMTIGGPSSAPTSSRTQTQRDTQPKAFSVESGTSTDTPQGKKPLEITFSSKSELTYAEKLLLKKLRREQGQNTSLNSDASSTSYNETFIVMGDQETAFFDDAALDAEVERVSFTALANASYTVIRDPSKDANEATEEERPESHVSIVEVKKGQFRESLKGLEQSNRYQVSEVPDDFVRKSQPRFSGPPTAGKDAFMTPSPPSSGKRRSPTTRRLVKSPQLVTQTAVVSFNGRSVSVSPNDFTQDRRSPRDAMSPRKRSTWNKSQDNVDFSRLLVSSDDPLKKRNKPPLSARQTPKVKKGASLSRSKTSFKDYTSDVPLDLSLEGHPLETSRTERSLGHKNVGQRSNSRSGSRNGSATSRAGSQPGSRPGSRTKGRVSLASIFGEGTLTKTPSVSLKEVADLAGTVQAPRYTPRLGDFLTSAVTLPQEDRVLTPSGRRNRVSSARTDKWKLSYKLYDMGPRSWRPESSLQIAVDQIEAIDLPRYYYSRNPDPEVEKECKVAYSLEGFIAEKTQSVPQPRPTTVFDSQDEVVMDLDTPRSPTFRPTPRSAFHETQRSVTFRAESPPSDSSTFRVSRPGTPGKTPRETPRNKTPRENDVPPVAVDREDMSAFDEDRATSRQEEEVADNDTLNQLEWELASETGRVDADGNISRMSMASPEPDRDGSEGENKTPEAQFDFNNQLRASLLMDDFEEMEKRLMEEEVKALE